MSKALVETVGHLAQLLQIALETHERAERGGSSPVSDVCGALGFDPAVVPMDHLATLLFGFTVFGTPEVCRSQATFQAELVDALPIDVRMLYRQVRMQPVRAWRYHAQPASRDVVSQLVGPASDLEELADGLIELGGGLQNRGGPCLGWPVRTNGLHIVVSAGPLSDDAVTRLSQLAPFPMPHEEHAFWSDQMEDVLRIAIDPMGVLRPDAGAGSSAESLAPDAFRDGANLVLRPAAQPHELLERVILAADFEMHRGRTDWYRQRLERTRWLREMIARAGSAPAALEPVRDALVAVRHHLLGYAGQSRFDGPTDPALEAFLPMARILAGFGVVEDAMPAATESRLRQLPSELLLLPDSNPIVLDVHGREPVRAALEWARSKHDGEARNPDALAVEMAFDTFRHERRWAATFASLDLEDDGHLQRIDLAVVMHALRTLYDPRVGASSLDSLELDARQSNWLEAALRSKPYTDANVVTVDDLPATEDALLELRNVGDTALLQLKRALLDLAQTWRARAVGHEPRSLRIQARSQVVAPGGSDGGETLNDGLAELADLFGDG